MTQEERLNFLIEYLLNENEEYKSSKIPESETERKNLFRALMNVRFPQEISSDFLKIQDEYLSIENSKKITDSKNLIPSKLNKKIFLWKGDITTLKIDAIVNAANSSLCGCFIPLHNCIDNAIHTKSGVQLRLCCSKIIQKQNHEEECGKAKITPAFNLPCKFILHTVGPIVQTKLNSNHEKLLESCYKSCLSLAEENKIESLAFCCISTGVFMFPNKRAAEIAVQTVNEFLKTSKIKQVVFNVFKDEDLKIYSKLLG